MQLEEIVQDLEIKNVHHLLYLLDLLALVKQNLLNLLHPNFLEAKIQ